MYGYNFNVRTVYSDIQYAIFVVGPCIVDLFLKKPKNEKKDRGKVDPPIKIFFLPVIF